MCSPLQGFFNPVHCASPLIDDYVALFGNLWDPATHTAVRVAGPTVPAWTPHDVRRLRSAVASALVYRINRLYDLMHHGAIFDKLEPGTSFRLQLYADAHLPLAARVERGESLDEAAFHPFLCFDETLLAHASDIAEAFVHTVPEDDSRRTCKRTKTLWEVFRRVMLRGVHPSFENKPKTFKTISADFADVFQRDDGVYVSEMVLCTLLGNYADAEQRPAWGARLCIYTLYAETAPQWLSKCDYLVYYSIRELIMCTCTHIPALVHAIVADSGLNERWAHTNAIARSVVERLRASIRDCSATMTVHDINETLKNRHLRLSKSPSALEHAPRPSESVATLLQRDALRRRGHASWKQPDGALQLYTLLETHTPIRFDSVVRVAENVQTLLNAPCEWPSDKVMETFVRACTDTDAAHVKDVLKALYIQHSMKTFRMPDAYARQLVETLRRESIRLTQESVERRCTLYACTDCMKIANTVLTATEEDIPLKCKLKYTRSIRIDICGDKDRIRRMCDACFVKRKADEVTLPLLEIPLLTLNPHTATPTCFGAYIFDQCIVMCPNCALCVERANIRFSNAPGAAGAWSCALCNPRPVSLLV